MRNIIRTPRVETESRPTCKISRDDLLGLVARSAARPIDLTPEIEILDPDDDLAISIELATGSGAIEPIVDPYVISADPPRADRTGLLVALAIVLAVCVAVASCSLAHP